MADTLTVEVAGTTYTLRRLSEYELLKIYGSEHDVADRYLDLIDASLVEPQLARDEIAGMDGFIALGLAILDQYQDVVGDFRASPPTG